MTTNADAARDAAWLAVYDKQLRPLTPEPIELYASKAMVSTPWNTFPALTFDGERLLVNWSQSNEDELSRNYGALFVWNGKQLERTRDAFRIGSTSLGDEGRASAATAGSGRFVVAWEEKSSSARGDSTGASIRMTALDDNGERLFVNPACNADDFQLNRALAGDQTNVSIAAGDDYTIQAIWTDNGVSDGNPRGAAMIRSVSLTYDQLFSDTKR